MFNDTICNTKTVPWLTSGIVWPFHIGICSEIQKSQTLSVAKFLCAAFTVTKINTERIHCGCFLLLSFFSAVEEAFCVPENSLSVVSSTAT